VEELSPTSISALTTDRLVVEPQCTQPPVPLVVSGWWGRFLALTRLSLARVCAESTGLGEYDYHNDSDDADHALWHVEGRRRCARCGKWFRYC
jgi:hypothetical protein